MNIFHFESGITYLSSWIKSQPRNGYGVAQSFSGKLGMSSVLFSQILSGKRNLQLEKALELTELMALAPAEKEFFILLIERENAGSEKLKNHFGKKIQKIKDQSLTIKEHVRNDLKLDELAKARFYSNWMYSAVRLATDIPGLNSGFAISERLDLPIGEVQKSLEFLTEHGLILKKNGQYSFGVQSTHLETNSPWIYGRQIQWRAKAQESMAATQERNLHYTGPMVLSREAITKIRERLIKEIKSATELASDSRSEDLYCLIIDWFKI